jgi:limonene-1,2-epoxide hydrolase
MRREHDERVVRDFIDAWNRQDFDRVTALLHPDIDYHNIPMAPMKGREAVAPYLRQLEGCDRIEWTLTHIASNERAVLTERIDAFVIRGAPISLPVMGVFEIEDGLIRAWRDYFDLASYQAQLARAPAPRKDPS